MESLRSLKSLWHLNKRLPTNVVNSVSGRQYKLIGLDQDAGFCLEGYEVLTFGANEKIWSPPNYKPQFGGVPFYHAITLEPRYYNNGRYTISRTLYRNAEEAIESFGDKFVQLADHLPPVMLPVGKRFEH